MGSLDKSLVHHPKQAAGKGWAACCLQGRSAAECVCMKLRLLQQTNRMSDPLHDTRLKTSFICSQSLLPLHEQQRIPTSAAECVSTELGLLQRANIY